MSIDIPHQMLTGGGLGAVNAMQDSVVLANCIYNMTQVTPQSITSVFEEYYRQRYPRLDAQSKRSQLMSFIMGGKARGHVKAFEYRPQVAWLPLIPNRGTGYVLPQEGPGPLPMLT
ncbi:hypothetical protein BGZ65_003448 [Modicella reniformis]|uniref:Uncharacterized protein n=1 Tax=Modicella reniformis TaxID=1440133 RepID=A0A9P6ML13_9FUNG|nr:hypothetical protein BGZ65_003448 [Modicella reniformis]